MFYNIYVCCYCNKNHNIARTNHRRLSDELYEKIPITQSDIYGTLNDLRWDICEIR